MGYSENDAVVRMDRFKPGGKWYDTFAVDMEDFYDWGMGVGASLKVDGETLPPTWGAVKLAIIHHLTSTRVPGETVSRADFERWTWVCLEPYHVLSHPIMFAGKRES